VKRHVAEKVVLDFQISVSAILVAFKIIKKLQQK